MRNQRLKTESKPVTQKYRTSGRVLWAVILIWAVLFFMIRTAFKIDGSPMLNFVLMLGLFFLVLFFLRVGIVRIQNWWRNTRPGLVRFLAIFWPGQRH